jgi:UDP-N-acetylmuramyl tripeptide synthase
MKTQMAIWAGKTAGVLSNLMGNEGTTIPGIVARKLDGGFLRHLRTNAKTIVYITGTNGKTTTANLLAHLLQSTGKKVIANLKGANMVTGISAVIVRHAPFIGWFKDDVAVMEVDEASLPKVVAECPPDYLIVTNFFRDQLDRYGEVDILIQKMKDCLKEIDVKLILNADDPFVHRFSSLKKENIYVGLGEDACDFQSYTMGESKYCPDCQNELSYHNLHFGHLGHYHCDCGFSRPQPAIEAEKVVQDEKEIHLIVNGQEYQVPLRGTYNAYNALLAIGACQALGEEYEEIQRGLTSFEKADGRMQDFYIGENTWRLNLVKNPAGANVTLSEFFLSNEKKQLIFCLNDNSADGRDISWIWDIDFEIANLDEVAVYIASGKRAYDAALRMKYAGIPEEKIVIIPALRQAVIFAKQKGIPAYFMATYTCLTPLVSILSRETAVREKGERYVGTFNLSFLSRHIKSLRRQGKYHLLKETLRMERNTGSNRGNQDS